MPPHVPPSADGFARPEFLELWDRARTSPLTPDEIRSLARSNDPKDRLVALFSMRERIAAGDEPSDWFELAQSMIDDEQNYCRWQALIVVGELIEDDPERVWEVAAEYGISPDDDMRMGVATVLLEHLLQYHFEWTMTRLRAAIRSGKERLASTLSSCSRFGQAEEQWEQVRELVASNS